MSSIAEIIVCKRNEVAEQERRVPVGDLIHSPSFGAKIFSLKERLLEAGEPGIIAEFKRRSPSRGTLNPTASVEQIGSGYLRAGASAISILTDRYFFGGSHEDVIRARPVVRAPILRKDFVVSKYQVFESKSIGADVILLIASVLDRAELRNLCSLAHELGLEVLMEVHSEEEYLLHAESDADFVGVNNRDLRTFEVSLQTSRRLAKIIPRHILKISESGIRSTEEIVELRAYGFNGFLIGEKFMTAHDPVAAASNFIGDLRKTGKLHED